MRETLVALYKLQQIDSKVLEIEKAAGQYPSRIKEKEALMEVQRMGLGALRSELEAKRAEQRDAENVIRDDTEKHHKWKRRLADIKTPREYQALSREVEGVERGIHELEDRVVVMMQEIEAKLAAVAEKEGEMRAVEAELGGQVKEMREKMAHITKEALEAKTHRVPLASKIPPNTLKLYERVRERRLGVAVAVAVGGTCGMCNVSIRPQLMVQVRKYESIEQCPSCSRIILVDSLVLPPPPDVPGNA